MSRIAYVNGRFVPHARASVHVEDRGYQFADGIYEVLAVRNGLLVDEAPHMERFRRSLAELRIAEPMSPAALAIVMRRLIRENRLKDGILYLQATRGVAPRDHLFPADAATSLVATVQRARPPSAAAIENGVAVITRPDIRWRRCDIKSVGLLANLLAKQAAREAGAYEAWFVGEDGFITEGSSTNAWIVTMDGEVVTRGTDNTILAGVTRKVLLELARRDGLKVAERPFTPEEAMNAREAFLTSTTSIVLPVTAIDGRTVGNGKPGSVALRLRRLYLGAASGSVAAAREAE